MNVALLNVGVGDLERSLARLHAAGLGGGMGRDAMKVVLYEDNAKRRVAAMIAGLRGLQTLNDAIKGFQPVLPKLASSLLQQLLTPGKGFPELDGPLDALEGATDWEEAAACGRATPRPVSCQKLITLCFASSSSSSSLSSPTISDQAGNCVNGFGEGCG